jgi:hypothetical protein
MYGNFLMESHWMLSFAYLMYVRQSLYLACRQHVIPILERNKISCTFRLKYLDDSDIRIIGGMPEFSSIARLNAVIAGRKFLCTARLKHAFDPLLPVADAGYGNGPDHGGVSARAGGSHCAKLGLSEVLKKNVIIGGRVATRLLSEGQYVLGPEFAKQSQIAKRLESFLLRRRLQRRLMHRISMEELVQSNILLTNPIISGKLHASLFSLQRAHLRKGLMRRIGGRPALRELFERGIVPGTLWFVYMILFASQHTYGLFLFLFHSINY